MSAQPHIICPETKHRKHRRIFLYEIKDGTDELIPFHRFEYKFKVPKTKEELANYLYDVADGLSHLSLFFSFKKNGIAWRMYKRGQEENEYKDLLSNLE